MQILWKLRTAFCVGIASAFLAGTGCEDDSHLDRAGEHLEEAAEETGEAIEEGVDEVREDIHDATEDDATPDGPGGTDADPSSTP